MRGELAALRLVVLQQQEKIRELEARLNLSSRNSSKPPSSDPPGAPRPPRSKGTGRKQGGQPGHKGKTRPWFPLDDVDEFVDVRPSHCDGYARPLGPAAFGCLDPWRHQIVEIPSASASVTEYVMHAAVCDACGEKTQASLPEGVMPWAVGPRLQAVLSTLCGRFRLSRREVLEAAEALFDLKARLALGTLVALEERTRLALAAAYEEAARAVQESSIVHPDETSYYEGTHKSWLWVAAMPEVAYYRIDPQRGRAAFGRLLPDFQGSIVVDRWNAYVRSSSGKASTLLEPPEAELPRARGSRLPGHEGRPTGPSCRRCDLRCMEVTPARAVDSARTSSAPGA